jgi:hypothetical protein
MLIRVIATVEDFAVTLDASMHRVNRWLLPEQGVWEAEVDAAVNEITTHRAALERPPREDPDTPEAQDQLSRVGACLAGVAPPLRRLQAMGFQLVAVLTTGTCVVTTAAGRQRAIQAVDMADYLVAPDPCYFRLARPDLSGRVHRLGAPCPPGHGDIVLDMGEAREKQFSIWSSMEILAEDFERTVPWCDACHAGDELF